MNEQRFYAKKAAAKSSAKAIKTTAASGSKLSLRSEELSRPRASAVQVLGDSGPEARGGFDASSYASLMEWAVFPEDAENSPLCIQVKEGFMPKTGGPLSDEEWQAICDWIDKGALKMEEQT